MTDPNESRPGGGGLRIDPNDIATVARTPDRIRQTRPTDHLPRGTAGVCRWCGGPAWALVSPQHTADYLDMSPACPTRAGWVIAGYWPGTCSPAPACGCDEHQQGGERRG